MAWTPAPNYDTILKSIASPIIRELTSISLRLRLLTARNSSRIGYLGNKAMVAFIQTVVGVGR